jgi:beta-N-acetylhexosaminidase
MMPYPRAVERDTDRGADTAPRLSRRDLLRATALASVGAFLAACGTTPTTAAPSGSATSGAPSGGATAGSTTPGTSGSAGSSDGSVSPATSAPTPSATATPSAVIGLSLREKIGRILVVGFTGTRASKTSAVGRAIAAGELGGVILFDRNIVSPSQLRGLTSGLSALAPDDAPLIVAVDQEGGQVLRLGPKHGFPNVPSQEAVGARGASYASSVYGAMAVTLQDAGINLNLAPVVDLNVNPRNPAIGALDRAFSADPKVVTALARAAVRAQHGHGVLTTLKHFPGLGSASANTDFTVVDVTKTWKEIELVPYRELITSGDVDCVMVGNMLNRQLDAKYPSSLSRNTIQDLLRGELGFDGPVITDDLGAAAITRKYRRVDAITLALKGGADLLLFAQPTSSATFYRDLVTSIEKVVKAGTIPEARIDQAVSRVEALRVQR